jgi:hypothetical protein
LTCSCPREPPVPAEEEAEEALVLVVVVEEAEDKDGLAVWVRRRGGGREEPFGVWARLEGGREVDREGLAEEADQGIADVRCGGEGRMNADDDEGAEVPVVVAAVAVVGGVVDVVVVEVAPGLLDVPRAVVVAIAVVGLAAPGDGIRPCCDVPIEYVVEVGRTREGICALSSLWWCSGGWW